MKRIILIIILLAGYILLILFSLDKIPSFEDIFKPRMAKISATPVLINEVKAISELFSVCYHEEIVIDSSVTDVGSILGLDVHSTKKLVYIVTGRVYAGIDLSQIDHNSFTVHDSVMHIRLSKPIILEVVINPSDFTTFVETGRWSFEEVTALKIRAREKILQRAIGKGILKKSKENGIKSLKSFYSHLGFKEVMITIDEPSELY